MTSSSHAATGVACARCGAYTDDGSAWCLGCRRESAPSRYRRVHLSKEEATVQAVIDSIYWEDAILSEQLEFSRIVGGNVYPPTALHGAGSTKETPTRL